MTGPDDAARATAETVARQSYGKLVAFLASRTNTLLSIPMLMFMQAGAHGIPF